MHVEVMPNCLNFWGGNLSTVGSFVKAEFKRRQNNRNYQINKEKEKERKRVEHQLNLEKGRERKRSSNEDEAKRKRISYAENQQQERERKATSYAKNPEAQRERKKENYAKNPDAQRERKKENYENNPEAQRERKKEDYEKNPEAQRERKKENYEKNPEAQRKRKTEKYTENLEAQRERKRSYEKDKYDKNPEPKKEQEATARRIRRETWETKDDLSQFRKEGKYGPIFPCVCCNQLKWQSSVVSLEKDELLLLPSSCIDVEHVNVNAHLFTKLDKFYLCKSCKEDLFNGQQPKLSTKNRLLCPWKDVPSELLRLNEVRKGKQTF